MSFQGGIESFQRIAIDKLETITRKTAIALTTAIIRGTPVDTSHARSNWFVDMNKYSDSHNASEEDMNTTMAKVISSIFKFKGGDIIHISNKIPYIVNLEYGHSKQAPKGMVRLNIQLFQSLIKEASK